MSDRQLRQQQQDTAARGRAERIATERQAAADRARLAAFYARARAQRAANTTT